MKKIYEQFFTIVGNFTGDCCKPIGDFSCSDWQTLFEISSQQKLECAVYESVYNTPSFEAAEKQLREEWKTLVKRRYLFEVGKVERFWDIYETLTGAGVQPLVLKGVVCRFLYSKPYARPSGDEDLLVRKEDLKKCHLVLEEMGLKRASDSDGNVLKYMDVSTGLQIEVHKSLFEETDSVGSYFNTWFENAFKMSEMVETDGHSIITMEPTYHLLYLFAHWIKHFVGPGIGIRQICDISKFINKWGESIDWEVIAEKMCGQKYGLLCANVIEIGIQYFHMERDKVGYPETMLAKAEPEALMVDLLKAGIYGSSSVSRLHSSTITLGAVEGNGSKLHIIFPEAKSLEKRYPYLKRCPWLLPIAWVSRLLSYGIEVIKNRRGSNSPGESIAIGSERVRLLKKYRVIK